jgi:hypothetical protein
MLETGRRRDGGGEGGTGGGGAVPVVLLTPRPRLNLSRNRTSDRGGGGLTGVAYMYTS